MRRWIARMSNFALMLVIPVVGWSEYLSYGAKRHWFDYRAAARGLWTEPARSWIVTAVMLVIALLGLHLATPRWSRVVKGVCAIGLAGFLLSTFLFLSFAEALAGSTRMR